MSTSDEPDNGTRVLLAPEREGVPVIDARSLPETVFGREALTWWATAGFILVEGTTLAVLATSFLYLRLNEQAWPPRPWPAPTLPVPSINLVLIMATMWPMERARRAACARDGRRVARWLWIATALGALSSVLRGYEFGALQVRWDTNAYGSAAWALLVSHTTLLVTDVIETSVMALLFARARHQARHFSDVEDAAIYQRFLSLSWFVLFVLVFLMPRYWS